MGREQVLTAAPVVATYATDGSAAEGTRDGYGRRDRAGGALRGGRRGAVAVRAHAHSRARDASRSTEVSARERGAARAASAGHHRRSRQCNPEREVAHGLGARGSRTRTA